MKTDLVEIFQTIRASLQPYTASGFAARTNSETAYELWTEKEINANGEKIEVMPYATLAINNEFVDFCLHAIEFEQELAPLLHPELVKLKTDQACFKINKLDDVLLEQIEEALLASFTLYKQKGWL